jgi:hypothetical protein
MVLYTHLFALKLSIVGVSSPYAKNPQTLKSMFPTKIKAGKMDPCHAPEKKEIIEHHHEEEVDDEERRKKEIDKKKKHILRARRTRRVAWSPPRSTRRKFENRAHLHAKRYAVRSQ